MAARKRAKLDGPKRLAYLCWRSPDGYVVEVCEGVPDDLLRPYVVRRYEGHPIEQVEGDLSQRIFKEGV